MGQKGVNGIRGVVNGIFSHITVAQIIHRPFLFRPSSGFIALIGTSQRLPFLTAPAIRPATQ
jgi:hypothetical protein